MKLFHVLALSLLLATSCSTTETGPVESETTVLPAGTEPSMSSDALFDPEPSLAESELATPVDPATPAPAPAEDMPSPVDSSTADSGLTQPTPPGPPPPPSFLPDTQNDSQADASPIPAPAPMPPVVESATAPASDRSVRQDFEEYKDRAQSRARTEDDFDKRALFPHEDGAFQFGLDYAYKPWNDLDLDATTARRTPNDSQGGVLSFNYFPLRSLSYGRLGLGAQAAAYWTKLDYPGAGGTVDSTSRHLIDTFGGRLIYEFQYFLGQIVVPYAFYGYDMVKVRALDLPQAGVSYPSQSFNSQNYGAGAHLNLNRLESSAASKALAGSGIRKFYLTYTYLQRAESTGAGHFLGLRFEY